MNSFKINEAAAISMCLSCGKTIEPINLGGRWVTPLCSCERKLKLEEVAAGFEKLRLEKIAEEALGANGNVKKRIIDNFMPRKNKKVEEDNYGEL